jgi:hypothetical protein
LGLIDPPARRVDKLSTSLGAVRPMMQATVTGRDIEVQARIDLYIERLFSVLDRMPQTYASAARIGRIRATMDAALKPFTPSRLIIRQKIEE